MIPVEIVTETKDHGLFGAIRKYDVHAGIDLYTFNECPVRSITAGTVVDVFQFTGEEVGMPWWNTTFAVVIRDGDYDVLYGELKPTVGIGDVIGVGDVIGHVTPVLKKDKGKNPTSMLHLELWKHGTVIRDLVWKHGTDTPHGLEDPTTFLKSKKILF